MYEILETLLIIYFYIKVSWELWNECKFPLNITHFDKLVMNNRKAKSLYFRCMPHIISSYVASLSVMCGKVLMEGKSAVSNQKSSFGYPRFLWVWDKG